LSQAPDSTPDFTQPSSIRSDAGVLVPDRAHWKAEGALGMVALVWGATFVVVKQALPHISTVYFLSLRFWLASLCMLVLFVRPFHRAGAAKVVAGLRGGATAGVFLWLGYTLQTYGLKYTTAGKSGFLTGLFIALVPLLAAARYRRWPQTSESIGIGLAVVGMAVLTLPSISQGEFRLNRGDALTILCAVAFAIHLLVLGHFAQRAMVEAVALGQIACAAALSTLVLAAEPPRADCSFSVLFALGITSVFATALAFTVQTWGQRHTTATRTALIFALEPVFALAAAAMWGHEALTWKALAGGALILGGILFVELKPTGVR
jgi:drug/metabolite transporter (DMT)-like permease